MRSEGYVPTTATPDQVNANILRLIQENGWEGNPLRRLCTMYLLGKAKSLSKPDWLWRGICAIPCPLINKRSLRIAAGALTTFLRLVTGEIAGNFLVHRVSEVSSWFRYLDGIGAKYITKINCKDQFNKIKPAQVVNHLEQALQWPTHRKRWRASEESTANWTELAKGHLVNFVHQP